MAAKRLLSDSDEVDQPKEKRMRFATRSAIPSFATIVGDMMTMNTLKTTLEPLLRKVVNEEVERGLCKTMRTMTRTPSFRIQALPEPPPTLKLLFKNKFLPPTLFTFNKILDINGNPLQLELFEQRGNQLTPTILPYPIKIEVVVINGDFPPSDREVWTLEEFNGKVVKEREGKRPLLTRAVNYTLRDTNWVRVGDVEFTDNSSWIRSRKFRLAARVVVGETMMNSGHESVRILEALTEPFVVKDHRGVLYKKHYPPMLNDDVWRLEKIGKDGIFHKRLEQEGIKTVQGLLKLFVVDPTKLKTILGGQKSLVAEKSWDAILSHARTCNLGNKKYISRGPYYTITLDPICQISSIEINGQQYSYSDLTIALKNEVNQLVMNAYENWSSLEEVDKSVNEILHSSQGNMTAECSNPEQSMMPYEIVMSGVQVPNSALPIMDFGAWDASTQNLM